MAKYIAILVALIFFINSVNSAALEPSAEKIRQEDAEEGKYYQRVEDVKDTVGDNWKFEPVKDDMPIYPLQNNDNEPEQIEEPEIGITADKDTRPEEDDKQTIVSRDVSEPADLSSPVTNIETKVENEETKYENHLTSVDIDKFRPEEDLDGTYHENVIVNSNSAEVNDKANEKTSASQNEINEEISNKLDGYDSNKSDIEIYDDIIHRFGNKDYEVDLTGNVETENPEEISEADFDAEQNLPSKETSKSSENENETDKTTEEQITKPEELSNESYDQTFPEVEENTDEEEEKLKDENYEDEPLHEMTDEQTDNVQIEESSQEESEDNNVKEIEYDIENEEDETNNDEIETESKTEEEELDAQKEDEEENETEVEESENHDEVHEKENIRNEELTDENIEEENEEEEEDVAEEVQSDLVDEDRNDEETEKEEAYVDEEGEDENENETEEELEENEVETESDAEEEENTREIEAIESDNEEENEEESSEDRYDIVDNVYPLQPPAIKDHNIIYAALKESSTFDKEEEVEEEEDEKENGEEANEDFNNNDIHEEVEPPGSLEDIQMLPFEASEEQIQTNENDCSLPAETGACRAYHKRFFYNSNTRECDVFVYGGCEGNANNFKTLDECVNTCVKQSLNL